MIKMVALLSRKPGLTLEEFRTYYEERHVPLIAELNPFMADYRRSYVDFATASKGGISAAVGSWAPDFDVLTEIWFEDRETFDKARAALTQPDSAARIGRDEENFLDRDNKRIFLVEEHGS